MTNAILIDPFEGTFSEVDAGDINESFEIAYKLIDTDIIEMVKTPHFTIYVDEEGRFRDPQRFFTFIGFPAIIAGKALVVGPTATVEDVRSCTMFVPVTRKEPRDETR